MILQRVLSAAVRVGGETVGRIGSGLVVLAGVERGDGAAEVAAAAERLAGLRLFGDAAGKMNRDAASAGAAFLVISQITLAGQPLARGRRPCFDGAAEPATARRLLDELAAELARRGFEVATGSFGAHMEVELVNDGPVTFVLDLPERAGR